MYVCAQSCLTLCDPMACSPPGSSIHRIFQVRILEWVAISYSMGSSQPRERTHVSCVSCIDRQILSHCATWEAPFTSSWLWIGASLVAQLVKNPSVVRETWARSLGWEDPLEKEMAPHSSTLAWKIPWTEKPGRLQAMGSQRDRHDWVTSLSLFTFMHWRRKWQPTPVFLPGEPQGQRSLVGCHLWGHTELDTTEATQQQLLTLLRLTIGDNVCKMA